MQTFSPDAIALIWDEPVWTMSATEVRAWNRPPTKRETSSRMVRSTFEPSFDCWAGDAGLAAAFRAGDLPTPWLLCFQATGDHREPPGVIDAAGYARSEPQDTDPAAP